MPTYNVLEAKTQLSRLIEAVESGREREIVIARNGKPAARLVAMDARSAGTRIGVAKGSFKVPETIDEDNLRIEALFNGDSE